MTKACRYLSRRSYVTLDGREFLAGEDASIRRETVRALAECRCASCGRVAWNGELDHIRGGRKMERDWRIENLQWLCSGCHRAKHGRFPRFGESKELICVVLARAPLKWARWNDQKKEEGK